LANALDNLERAFEFLAVNDPILARRTVAVIRSAVDALAEQPLVCRSVERDLRELVIALGKTGYIALYRFRPERDLVIVLAPRHQRELDYP
jgi:plasmid stabilization system protein ParE